MTYWLRVGLMALATLCALGSATLLFRARNDRASRAFRCFFSSRCSPRAGVCGSC